MKLLIFTLLCALVGISSKTTHKPSTTTTKKLVCEGVHVRGNLHKQRVLMSGINRPYQLAIYTHEHQIFFSYNVGEDTQDTFGIAYVKPNDTMPTPVHGVKNGFALAVDEHNKKAFFGGSDGIYEADLTKFEGVKHIVKHRDIWDMFYHHHHLYFIEYPSQHLHKYNVKDKTISAHEHIKEKIYQFAIDGENDVFITTKNGLFEIKNGTNATISYTGPIIFRAAEVNHKGEAHFCAKNGIYVPHKENKTLIEIASIKNTFGLAFDTEDNIIYSDPHRIIKLLPHDCK
ncbi:ommochrome-binding protein-like [Anticarsia gemmatalis]|uniref:ommochrome-binding protein-like n=1 Tax=Anticarsia gemmatalis TaxID=129554 RepID=UPI003F75814D